MKHSVLFICACALVFTSLAMQSVQAESNSYIDNNSSRVKTVLPEAADWCELRKKCKFIRSSVLRIHAKDRNEAIQKSRVEASKETLAGGGDTFLYEAIKKEPEVGVAGEEDWVSGAQFIVYGMAMRCSSEFQGAQNVSFIKPLYRSMVTSLNKEEQCGVQEKCNLVRPLTCSTFQNQPYLRCLRKSLKTAAKSGANKLVITNEIQRNGRFKLLANAYSCAGSGEK